ncbi:MAG TPA: DUF4263 domain-containing protein [Coriobacteriia bacterium]|nr:DUF4263 domain-containing protein [Coriobacteriia bacterium]
MSLSPDKSLEDVKVRIRQSVSNPNVGKIEQAVLKEGPRAFRLATLTQILDADVVHHYSLKIDSIDRKKDGWFYKPEKSVTLEGRDPDEIERLFRFLQAHLGGKLDGADEDLQIVRSSDYQKLEQLLGLIPQLASPDMIELVKLVIPRIKDSSSYLDDFLEAFENSDPETVRHIAIASRVIRQRRAHARLQDMIDSGETSEQGFQEHLASHPWMFGSEYSELLDRRKWTRDDNLDFMLRRTTDNYLEILEIKTPFSDALFIEDKSHDSYYPSAKLSPVIGQVIRYICEVERNRDSIISRDGHDPLKIRARVIVGRDGDAKHQEALRNLNAHLHRIEILTFDQLARISSRALDMFEGTAGLDSSDVEEDSVPPF